jgi:N-hydroxyarylamine O-acetyltransferase
MTLNCTQLTRTDHEGRHTKDLVGDDAIREAYEKHFGIVLTDLPKEPGIDSAIRIIMQID